jgi:hypothetical protein
MSSEFLLSEENLFIQLTAELEKESDRALAIVAAAYLDHLLEILISNKYKLSKKKRDNIFKYPAGMLHSFAFRITFAHMTKLINEDQKQDLNKIRDIRNVFAHQLIGISFNAEEITESCKQLILARIDGTPSTAKEQFKKSAVRIMVDLIVSSNHFKEGENDSISV